MRIRVTGPANRDLRSVFEFLDQENPRAAAATMDILWDAIESLAVMPGRGRPGRMVGSRELVVGETGHIIIYALRIDEVAVLRIRHGRQLWPA